MRSSAAIAVFGLASQADAWWNNGHMFTARVAFDYLSDKRPDVLKKANGILANLASFTDLETSERAFVECATFPDKIKHRGFSAQSHWHFVDTPIQDGVDLQIPDNPWNIIWAINTMKWDLKYAKPEGNPTVGENVNDTLFTSIDLRFLIHYVGDIHQPLHATSRFTPDRPNGDRGGNDFKLEKTHGIDELHALWDSIVLYHKSDFKEPLTDFHWEEMGNISAEITEEFPISKYGDDLLKKPKDWAEESYNIAKDFVYVGIKEGEWPSDDYLEKGQTIARERIAMGGYRLALTLIDLWGDLIDEAPPVGPEVENLA